MKFLILALLVAYCSADKVSCPSFRGMENFDVSRYLGTWYEIQRLPTIFESLQSCITAVYTLGNNSVNVFNTGYIKVISGLTIPVKANGEAFILNPERPSELGVKFSPKQALAEPNYVVLDTDYENYTLIYSCVVGPSFFLKRNTKTEYGWILSRKRTLDATTLERLRNRFQALGINMASIITVDQTDC